MKVKICRVCSGLNTELEQTKTLSGLSGNLDDEKDIYEERWFLVLDLL